MESVDFFYESRVYFHQLLIRKIGCKHMNDTMNQIEIEIKKEVLPDQKNNTKLDGSLYSLYWIQAFSSVFRIQIQNGLIISNRVPSQYTKNIHSFCARSAKNMHKFLSFFSSSGSNGQFFSLYFVFRNRYKSTESSRYVASINSRQFSKVKFVAQADGKLISIIVVLVFLWLLLVDRIPCLCVCVQ